MESGKTTDVATSKMYILRKTSQMLQNITFPHFMANFHNIALKKKPGWAASVSKPILETRNVNNVCDYAWLLFLTESNYLEPPKGVF